MYIIKIAGIVEDSTVDGPGIRMTVFTQGCPRDCEDCHNESARSMTGGYEISSSEILERAKKNPLLDGVTFSGGEPFMQVLPLTALAKEFHSMGLNVITYTGFTFEELINDSDFHPLLSESDFIVDGPYVKELRNDYTTFKGSENQRIIDVKKSLAERRAVQSEWV